MASNIRVNLKTHLLAESAVSDLVDERVFSLMRPQGSDLPCIVFRKIPGGDFGLTTQGDSDERAARFELVAWAATPEAAIELMEALETLYHGTGRFAMGDIAINCASKVDDYDGDRVTEAYADEGGYPITSVFEFIWDA